MRISFLEESWTQPPSRGLAAVPGPVRKLGLVLESPFKDETGAPQRFWGAAPIAMKDGSYRMYCGYGGPSGVRLAASKDGLAWEFPDGAPLLRIEGAQGNPFQPRVVPLDDGGWRMYLWLHESRPAGDYSTYRIAESRDGLDWKLRADLAPVLYHPNTNGYRTTPPKGAAPAQVREFLERKRFISNDSVSVHRDPRTGRFEMLHVVLLPNPPGTPRHVADDNLASYLRVVVRRTSADGIRWGDPDLLFAPGEPDPPTMQFYGMELWPRDEGHAGFLQTYLCAEKAIDTELVVSRDLVRWQRPARGRPFLPRGGEDAQDSMMIAVHGPPLGLPDGRRILYYSGWPNKHGSRESRVPRRPGVMAAEIDENRLVGLRAGKEGGLLVTPAFRMSAALTVDGDIDGQLRARLTDVFGAAIPQCDFGDGAPVHGAGRAHPLSWKGRPAYEMVKLEVRFDSGTLYGISAGE